MGEISKYSVPWVFGSKIVFLGKPVFASQTTSIESGPTSAVTIISFLPSGDLWYAEHTILLQCPYNNFY